MPLPDGRVCTTCEIYKESNNFYLNKRRKLRAECKECANDKAMVLYRKKRDSKDPAFYAARMASGAIQRCNNYHEIYEHYRRLGIEVEFDTHEDFSSYISDNFSEEITHILNDAGTPSLDRVDPNGNYRAGNLRVIEVELNRLLGSIARVEKHSVRLVCTTPDNTSLRFKSIKEASEKTGLDRATIRRSYKLKVRTKAGYTFRQIEESEAV